MLFCFHSDRDTLQRALRAAVTAHRPDVLHDLLARQGEARFADGLTGLTARVLADALSMLPADRRADVVRHLPRSAQAGSPQAGKRPAKNRTARARTPRQPLQGLLVWGA
jgi:hypothetical protein